MTLAPEAALCWDPFRGQEVSGIFHPKKQGMRGSRGDVPGYGTQQGGAWPRLPGIMLLGILGTKGQSDGPTSRGPSSPPDRGQDTERSAHDASEDCFSQLCHRRMSQRHC